MSNNQSERDVPEHVEKRLRRIVGLLPSDRLERTDDNTVTLISGLTGERIPFRVDDDLAGTGGDDA